MSTRNKTDASHFGYCGSSSLYGKYPPRFAKIGGVPHIEVEELDLWSHNKTNGMRIFPITAWACFQYFGKASYGHGDVKKIRMDITYGDSSILELSLKLDDDISLDDVPAKMEKLMSDFKKMFS